MTCPLCGSESTTVISEHLREGPGNVLLCASCDIAFLEDRTKDWSEYYKQEYWATHGPDLQRATSYKENFETYVRYQQSRLDALAPYFGPEKRLLEIGCASGQFLFHARDRVAEAVGVDLDEGATQLAREMTGCRTISQPLEETDVEKESFDIVCAFQTLEHVPEPVAFIEMLGSYLKPGGVIAIEVPNLYDPLISLYDNAAYKKFYYHGEHVFYFSKRSLETVMTRAGFDCSTSFTQDYNFTNHLNWVHKQAPQGNCDLGLGPAVLPLAESLPPDKADAFNAWLASVNDSYFRFLADHELTSNIFCIGRRAT
jgi:2-polyprenyl-3-methyl-5-hydroxy-6-metoxy-1,4-benzoquinol methylase